MTQDEMHQGQEVSGGGVGQAQRESRARGLDQFERAALTQAGRQSRGSQFDEGRRSQTPFPLHTPARQSALEIVVVEPESCRRGTKPMRTREISGGSPEFFGKALPAAVLRPPGVQALGQRFELWWVGGWCR